MSRSFDVQSNARHIKVCQVMHKCHNYHAILHKLYTWFGKNELRLYLNGAKISSIGGARPPSKYAHDVMPVILKKYKHTKDNVILNCSFCKSEFALATEKV